MNPVHNAPRLFVTGLGVQADRARRGQWGRERSVIDRPGSALPDFDRLGPAWGVGEGEVCDFSPAASPAFPFPHPPKPPSQTQRLTELIYKLHRERAVIGRIFQALPTQTDTTVALIIVDVHLIITLIF